MKTWSNDNPECAIMKMTVLELSTAPLDAALFEVPEGYRDGAIRSPVDPSPPAITTTTTVKRTGAVRIGVLPFQNQEPTIAALLRYSKVEAVALASADFGAVKAAGCDYVLETLMDAGAKPEGKKRFGMFAKLSGGGALSAGSGTPLFEAVELGQSGAGAGPRSGPRARCWGRNALEDRCCVVLGSGRGHGRDQRVA